MRCQRHSFDMLVVSLLGEQKARQKPTVNSLGWGRWKGVRPRVRCVKTGAFSPFTSCNFCWQVTAAVGVNEGPAEES